MTTGKTRTCSRIASQLLDLEKGGTGELQDRVGGPCLIQPRPDQEHTLSHQNMAKFVSQTS